MTKAEKQQNMVMIIQVPLAQKSPAPVWAEAECADGCEMSESDGDDDCYDDEEEKADVEDAIIKIGESEGPFREIPDLDIKRDPRFPVRYSSLLILCSAL